MFLTPLLALAGCAPVGGDPSLDPKSIDWSDREIALVLRVANEATLEALDIDARLDSRAAQNIVTTRAGADALDGTADDVPFTSIQALDDVKYVGASALEALRVYAFLLYGAEPVDRDGDLFLDDVDCDDEDPLVHPEAVEVCDGVDNDCDPSTTEEGLVTLNGSVAYTTLAEAVDRAPAGSDIAVCPGVHEGPMTIYRDMAIRGVGDRDDIIVTSQGAPMTLTVSYAAPTIENLSITSEDGGGIEVSGKGTTTLRGLRVHDTAEGAVSAYHSSWTMAVVIEDSLIDGNSASSGAGIDFNGSTDHPSNAMLFVSDTVIEHNAARNHGGGITINGGGALLARTFIQGNTAIDYGGGIFVNANTWDAVLEVVDTSFGVGSSADNTPDDLVVWNTVYTGLGDHLAFTCTTSYETPCRTEDGRPLE